MFNFFVDMDGVLCDFLNAFEILGHGTLEDHEKKYGKNKFWKIIDAEGLEFWSNMKWKDDGRKLWDFVKQYNPTILSSPSKSPDCKEGKKIWVQRELGDDVKLILEKDKEKYACSKCVLVDDTEEKINKWQQAGGIAIFHKNTEDTVEAIQGLFI